MANNIPIVDVPHAARLYYARISPHVNMNYTHDLGHGLEIQLKCSKCGEEKITYVATDKYSKFIDPDIANFYSLHKHRIVLLDIEPIMQSIQRDLGLNFDDPDSVTEEKIKEFQEASQKFVLNVPEGFGLIVNRGKVCERLIESDKHL